MLFIVLSQMLHLPARPQAWLEDHGAFPMTLRDIKQNNPSAEELRTWRGIEQRSASAEVFQHQWTAIQGPGSEGQAVRPWT